MLSAGGTARRLLERGCHASGFVAIRALVVSCAIDDENRLIGTYGGSRDDSFELQSQASFNTGSADAV
jgi:hypothetical protein